MKKLLLYPFDKDMCPIVRHTDMLDKYNLTAAIPRRGFAFEGKDISELDGGPRTGFTLGKSLSEEIGSCDVVLLNTNKQGQDIQEYDENAALIKKRQKNYWSFSMARRQSWKQALARWV